MKVQYKCLPCIVNQAIKVADMTVTSISLLKNILEILIPI